MGCCFSKDEDKENGTQEANETTRLLHNVADDTQSREIRTRNGPTSETYDQGDKHDEQSVLNRILHQTANDIIDVAALDGQTIEHSDYMDKAHQYEVRLSIACAKISPFSGTGVMSCTGVAAPQIVLGAQPVSTADLQLVRNAAILVSRAAHEMKVPHKEDLVVPFGVP